VSVDERTDTSRRKVGNIAVGVLENEETLSEESFLLSCSKMSAVNHTTVELVLNEVAHTLWPDGVGGSPK
jgi:hypothetical protein